MARKPKPSHVVELPLDVNAADARRLLGVFTAGSRLNNVLLQDGLGWRTYFAPAVRRVLPALERPCGASECRQDGPGS